MPSDPDVYPYSTIAFITDTMGGETWQGSGVLISPDEVLTASHVVYNATSGAATNITVSLGYGGGVADIGTISGAYTHYNTVQDGADTLTNEQSQYDYAVIHLSKPFTGVGTMGLESNFAGGTANVSGYPAAQGGQLQTSQETLTKQPTYTILNGTSLGPGSSGGPVWVTGTDGEPYVTGVVSTAEGGVGSQGYFTQISTAAFNQIEAWVAQDDGGGVSANATARISVLDTTTGQQFAPAPVAYSGPVAGLSNQYINLTTDNLNIAATSPGWFIHGGSGINSMSVSSGTNVLDAGTSSSFMTGGTGPDVFYADSRGSAVNFWDTVNNFQAGDTATIWGVSQAGFTLAWANNQGAAGYLGLTLHASSAAGTSGAMTFAGYSRADLQNGRLQVSFGTETSSGVPYLTVTAHA
jgi:V8-like Glu-specific endopeptidase